VYTDPKLLDVRGALDTLPMLPLTSEFTALANVMRATGTDDAQPGTSPSILSALAPTLAPNWCKRGQTGANADAMASDEQVRTTARSDDVTGEAVKRKEPLTIPVGGSHRAGDRIRTDDVQLGKLAFYH